MGFEDALRTKNERWPGMQVMMGAMRGEDTVPHVDNMMRESSRQPNLLLMRILKIRYNCMYRSVWE
jgi:hypothetical protein